MSWLIRALDFRGDQPVIGRRSPDDGSSEEYSSDDEHGHAARPSSRRPRDDAGTTRRSPSSRRTPRSAPSKVARVASDVIGEGGALCVLLRGKEEDFAASSFPSKCPMCRSWISSGKALREHLLDRHNAPAPPNPSASSSSSSSSSSVSAHALMSGKVSGDEADAGGDGETLGGEGDEFDDFIQNLEAKKRGRGQTGA